MRISRTLPAVYLLFAAISAVSFAPPVEAQIDFKLKTTAGSAAVLERYYYNRGVQNDCVRGVLGGCVAPANSSQVVNWTGEFSGRADVNSTAQALSVSGQMQHSGADKENKYGEATSNYMAQVFADVPPGAGVKIIFRHSVSTTWNIPVNGGYGQAAWSFYPYGQPLPSVGGGVGVDRAVPSGAPLEVSVSTVETTARAPSPYAGANGGTLVDGGTTYYYIGYFDISGYMWMEREIPAGESGSYSSSIDNIEVRRIGKVLKKLPEGDAQTGLVTKPLPKGLNVRVVNDDTGISVVNEPVTFTVVAPGHNASLSATPVTDLNGYATAYLTLGTSTGNYIVRATCPGCIAEENTVFFMATAKAVELRKIPGDGTSPVGRQTLNPLKVQAYNPITNVGEAGYLVDFSVLSTPAGGEAAKLDTAQSITNKFGNASSEFTLGESIGDYTIKARCESCLGNPEAFLTVTGTARVEDTHLSGGEEKTTYTPPETPGEIGLLWIAYQNDYIKSFMPNEDKMIAVVDGRIGVFVGDTLTFIAKIAPKTDLPPTEYHWNVDGSVFPGTKTFTTTFNTEGKSHLVTLEVKGKSRSVVVTVIPTPSEPNWDGWITAHNVAAMTVLQCGSLAMGRSTLLSGFNDHNNIWDAERHALWNACITNILDASVAKAATDARERTSYEQEYPPRAPNEPQKHIIKQFYHNEIVMDTENNAVGQRIGGDWPHSIGILALQQAVDVSAAAGELTILDAPGNWGRAGLLRSSK